MLSIIKRHYFLVLTPTGFSQLAYYAYESPLERGTRVQIPWGTKQVVGLIIEQVDEPKDINLEKIKAITAKFDNSFQTQELFNQWYELLKWASNYYHATQGDVFTSAVPKRFLQDKPWLEAKFVASKLTENELVGSEIPPTLTDEQQQSLDGINQSLGVHLLMGATGSGKTEVYMRLVADALFAGKKVLIIVPEIGLIPQTCSRFEQRFSYPVQQYHSAMTDRQRFQVWVNCMQAEPHIIIGTRSSIFLPIENLALIVIDEEHDLSLRQQDGFHYHARDIAVVRAHQQQLQLVLGTATPALETLHNAYRGKYKIHYLNQRIAQQSMPAWKLVDLSKQTAKKIEAGLSEELITLIGRVLARGEQVMIFLNRRGYAPTLRCNDCNCVVQCPFCSVNMTLHSKPNTYTQCHQCGETSGYPKQCVECSAKQFHYVGLGTERIEDKLQQLFKATPIYRIDSDSTSRKGSLEAMLTEIKQGGACIMLGTQMMSKGHHLPNMSLVAIVDTDNLLFSSDFRALERLAQLLVQVSGRVGRGDTPGVAVLQSYNVENPWLQKIITSSYSDVMKQLLEEREQGQLPPFKHMATLHSSSLEFDYPFSVLQQFRQHVQLVSTSLDVTLIGPMPALVERRNNRYRYQLQVVASKRSNLHQWIDSVSPWLNKQSKKKNWRWSIEVDPQNFD